MKRALWAAVGLVVAVIALFGAMSLQAPHAGLADPNPQPGPPPTHSSP